MVEVALPRLGVLDGTARIMTVVGKLRAVGEPKPRAVRAMATRRLWLVHGRAGGEGGPGGCMVFYTVILQLNYFQTCIWSVHRKKSDLVAT